jgi:hypothetical protein
LSVSTLCGRDGVLLSVSISVDPRHLESLLESLALLRFPINPQIYHDAALVYRFADAHEESEGTTLVEFPIYENQIEEVTGALEAYGFDRRAVQVIGMLDEIQSEPRLEAAPQGAKWLTRYRVKRRAAVG